MGWEVPPKTEVTNISKEKLMKINKLKHSFACFAKIIGKWMGKKRTLVRPFSPDCEGKIKDDQKTNGK